ncbi:penicillin acylase family protein [Paraflavisolibacter sp. H34]|uniref:penicillin acylase family protein n=1 Tax=Huijunlia imazamoxiresistens TaxID=3127457 RepID=UPI003016E4A6
MRIIFFILSALVTSGLIIALNFKWGKTPPLGKFLSPQQGFWQNAEPLDADFGGDLSLPGLKGPVNVYFDDRLVPHVFAREEADAYFVQGYLHAKFRLWQMEFQTRAAAGRVSEVLGADERFLRFDREQRRMGMVFGAENSLGAMEADSSSKPYFDAYSAGVNAYIATLTESTLPLEYKLLDYQPEKWNNLKIALFQMQMTKVLAGFDRDLEFTGLKSLFSEKEMNLLFPQAPDSLAPIVPKGTAFAPPSLHPVKPATADSLYFKIKKDTTAVKAVPLHKPDRSNGSNNWAVSGKKTRSGAPILCNDPHLELSLPSIWYEMQLSTPTMNAYGASFPGAPSIIIGFNDSLAFGFTNAQRDVKDYYAVRFKDASRKEYWFDGQWRPAQLRVEEIRVRNALPVKDTVAYTLFGPVIQDASFRKDSAYDGAIALRWVAHDTANDAAMWFRLNRAKNYANYLNAIRRFAAPGQNMLVATKSGDIALWQQAKFPARWKGQGLYVMPGEDSSYMWQGYIPWTENPHVINPAEGFIQSANQRPVDTTYPYFIPGNYLNPRGFTLHRRLQQMQDITPSAMMALQNDYYNRLAAEAVPLLLKYVNEKSLNATEQSFLSEVKKWNFLAARESPAMTTYQTWMDSLMVGLWQDDFSREGHKPTVFPDDNTTVELLLKDSALEYIDDRNTPGKETLEQLVSRSFRKAVGALQGEKDRRWWKHKNPTIYHLLRTSVLPFARTDLKVGGASQAINAMKVSHGPSWRMIVHLTTPTEAYGVYPGGQSGNPGSRFYDSFVDQWASGKYYPLWLMKESEAADQRVKWKLALRAS